MRGFEELCIALLVQQLGLLDLVLIVLRRNHHFSFLLNLHLGFF
jgi:hypothetical protein